MALPLPRLDDCTFAMLVREGQALIPRRVPLWTDHNVHDPGITLLELFSALVEQDIYRLDRTPPESTRAFLRMVGVEPSPPAVAAAVLELRRLSGSGAATVAAGQRVTDAVGAVAFELASPVYVADARLAGLATGASGRWIERRTEAALAPFGDLPVPGDALYLGFDASLGAGGERASLHMWTGDDAGDAETRQRLVAESGPDWQLHYGVRTILGVPVGGERMDVAVRGRGSDPRAVAHRLRPLRRPGRSRAGRGRPGGVVGAMDCPLPARVGSVRVPAGARASGSARGPGAPRAADRGPGAARRVRRAGRSDVRDRAEPGGGRER